MQTGRRRLGIRNGVVAGSVWESRMKLDEVKGGIKVFNGGEAQEEDARTTRLLKRNKSDSVGERRRWKPEIDKLPIQLRKTRSDAHRVSEGTSKESGAPREKSISRSLSNADQIRSSKIIVDDSKGEEKEKEEEEEEVEEEEEEEEEEEDDEEEDEEKGEIDTEKERFDIKEMNLDEGNPKKDAIEEKTLQLPISKIPISANMEKKLPPVIEHPSIDPDLKKQPSVAVVDEPLGRAPDASNRLQSLVDLVMWKDISKSALVFGFGTFILISSSFAKDLNFSFISAISYMGLIYLAIIFFYKSILLRGADDYGESHQKYMVGEEEAFWVVKMALPYFNELLFKIRSLFSGDPATTMKVAILLFALARCGSSVTLWSMAKLAFFGVFTVPKMCSAYSSQLRSYGRFWMRRFKDGWDSCSHKRAVAATIFTVIWNLSTVVARIWAVFMLIVVVKLYQQSLLREEWIEAERGDHVEGDGEGGQGEEDAIHKSGPTLRERPLPQEKKMKKRS